MECVQTLARGHLGERMQTQHTTHIAQTAMCHKWTIAWLACTLLSVGAVYNDSIFSAQNLYPRPWFAVDPGQIPDVANNGLILRQNTITPIAFAQNVLLGIANQQRNEVSTPMCSAALGECRLRTSHRGCDTGCQGSRMAHQFQLYFGWGVPRASSTV